MFRDCFRVRVTARWCLAERPVYFRGRILPVSVTYRTMACGLVNGISAGVGVCCVCSEVLILKGEEEGECASLSVKTRFGPRQTDP